MFRGGGNSPDPKWPRILRITLGFYLLACPTNLCFLRKRPSKASFSHRNPDLLANVSRASSHLVVGLPRRRCPPLGSQCTMSLDQRLSVRRMTCPAQRHLRRRCSATQSDTFPFSMAHSTFRAVRCSHSTQLSLTLPAPSPLPRDDPPLFDDIDDDWSLVGAASSSGSSVVVSSPFILLWAPQIFRSIFLCVVLSLPSLLCVLPRYTTLRCCAELGWESAFSAPYCHLQMEALSFC